MTSLTPAAASFEGLSCLSRQVPPVSLKTFLGAGVDGSAGVWDARGVGDPSAFAFRGAALTVDLPDVATARPRFLEAGRSVVAALASFGSAGDGLRAYATLPFDPQDGGATIRLPRWTFETGPDAARLTLVGDSSESRSSLLRALDELTRTLDQGDPPELPASSPPSLEIVDDGAAAYRDLVGRALDALREGGLEKVVTARRVRLRGAVDPVALLLALPPSRTTRFLFERPELTFLGATPETLVRLSGGFAEADALAGSCSPGEGREAALLGSEKDLREHAHVVHHLVSRLGALGELLPLPPCEVLRLPNVWHLRTPVRARVRPEVTLLDLVASLHPTPAVLGVPAAAAAHFLSAHEGFSRGFYGAPVGYVDARGEGAFVVGIRSLALVGGEAHLFAGGGIVSGSDIESELRETDEKLAPLRDRLLPAGARSLR